MLPFSMGIETIFLVFGVIILVPVIYALSRSREAARKDNPKPDSKP